ncbi:MAG: FO synthase [Peptococcaceae bacterium]|nr:FO synthase [Peptococcaceae bacterium]
MVNRLFAASELADLIAKVESNTRLDFADGVRLFCSPDLLAIGYMADLIRQRKQGDLVLFMYDDAISDQETPSQTTATMLYGQGETVEEKVNRLLQLRELQEHNAGFRAFAPIASAPSDSGNLTGFDDLKTLAIARIMLDNFDHIKSFWPQIGAKLTQVSLSFGVDDLEGNAPSARAMSKATLLRLIRTAGRRPIERDAMYRFEE